MVAYAAPTRLVSVRIVQNLQNNNYFLQNNENKFGNTKYFCYLCIVKMMRNVTKNISKKVKINLVILIFLVIFVL